MDDTNVFIEAADDSQARMSEVPQSKRDEKTVAVLHYEMIAKHPYKYTEPEIAFDTFAAHNHVPVSERPAAREKFFSKGQPCLRTSPLARRYGWGFHKDADGKVAIYPIESKEYKRLASDPTLKHMMAMRSKRA